MYGSASQHDDAALARVDALGAALAEIRDRLRTGMAAGQFMLALCRHALGTFDGADYAAVTLLRGDGGVDTAAFTDNEVLRIEAMQFASNQGPCLESPRRRTLLRANWEQARSRWPSFATNTEVPARSFLSAPLNAANGRAGALNLYGRADAGFSDLDAALLRIYIIAAENILAMNGAVETAAEEIAGLRRAMDNRAVIEQAKGIIMSLRRVGADDAFDVLVETSQHKNTKLALIAQRTVDTLGTSIR